MARRRYGKSPATSTAGHSERPPNPTGDESLAQPLAPLSEQSPQGASDQNATPEGAQHYDVSNLKAQIEAQRHYAEQHALHQYIASNFPGAPPHEAQWLAANPHHLRNPALIHAAAQIAAQRGIPRHDPQFLTFIGQLLDQHHAAMMQAPPPAPPMPPPMPPMPAHTHIDVEKVEGPEGEPEEEHMAAHFMSAPVSRADTGHSVEPDLLPSQVRLSKAEREHAAASGVSDEVYAREKLRMMKLKKAKVIKDD